MESHTPIISDNMCLQKSGKSGISHGKGEGHVVHAGVNCVFNVCGSAHSCGCVVNDSFARVPL